MMSNELMNPTENFSDVMITLNAALELSKSNTENISTIIGEIKTQRQVIGNLTKSVADIDTAIKQLNDDFEIFKLNEEVTDAQATSIRSACEMQIAIGNGHQGHIRRPVENIFSGQQILFHGVLDMSLHRI